MSKAKALRALRRFCLECQGDDAQAVRGCNDEACPLWPFRARWRAAPGLDFAGPAEQGACAMGEQTAEEASPSPVGASAQQAACGTETADLARAALAGATEPAERAAALAQPPQCPGAPLRAIRRQCLQCADNRRDVRACDAKDSCVLWSYRFGVLPETYLRVKRRISANKPLYLIKIKEK